MPRLESHFSFPLTQGPQDTSQFVDTTLQRVLSSVGGVTLRTEAGGRNPPLGRLETRQLFKAFVAQSIRHPLGALDLV